ncbi:MAG: KOW motif-containing protein [archaeon]
MRLTRNEITTKMPIPRKGNKYVVRSMRSLHNSVPVLIAIRDMLKLARTAKEVQKMINEKILKINGRIVKNYRESILIFNVLEADKKYILSLLPTNKYILEPTKEDNIRLCKVTNKRLITGNKIQLNMHDGSNVVTKDKIAVEDSVYLDFAGKIKKHVALEKGKNVFIISGKNAGQPGKVESVSGKLITLKLEKGSVTIPAREVVAQ